ncbi:MAG: hypothetical protein JSS04_08980 [Proteobacteria bacterium]|nr:hypothetical protein [Pseudomonadota bacterium]
MFAGKCYLLVGLVLVFVGPAARLRRQEREEIERQAHDQPRWKLVAFSGTISLGIIIFWPVLAVSAARTEADAKAHFGLLNPDSVEPSAALDRWVSKVQARYSGSLPFEDYREISSKLSWSDQAHFDSRLARLGYVVTGFAIGPEGQEFAVAVTVLKIGTPLALTELLGRAGSLPAEGRFSLNPLQHGLQFRLPPKPDDAVWQFSSSPDSWAHLAGRAGLALVRERTVVDAYVTSMS